MMDRYASKKMLQSIIRQTDRHNQNCDERDMWRAYDKRKDRDRSPDEWQYERKRTKDKKKKHSSSMNKSLRSAAIPVPKAYMDRENDGSSSSAVREVKKSTHWMRKLNDAEKSDSDRWGHAGFEELYPGDFKSDRSDSSPERPRDKVHKAKKKMKKHKKLKKSSKSASKTTKYDSDMDEEVMEERLVALKREAKLLGVELTEAHTEQSQQNRSPTPVQNFRPQFRNASPLRRPPRWRVQRPTWQHSDRDRQGFQSLSDTDSDEPIRTGPRSMVVVSNVRRDGFVDDEDEKEVRTVKKVTSTVAHTSHSRSKSKSPVSKKHKHKKESKVKRDKPISAERNKEDTVTKKPKLAAVSQVLKPKEVTSKSLSVERATTDQSKAKSSEKGETKRRSKSKDSKEIQRSSEMKEDGGVTSEREHSMERSSIFKKASRQLTEKGQSPSIDKPKKRDRKSREHSKNRSKRQLRSRSLNRRRSRSREDVKKRDRSTENGFSKERNSHRHQDSADWRVKTNSGYRDRSRSKDHRYERKRHRSGSRHRSSPTHQKGHYRDKFRRNDRYSSSDGSTSSDDDSERQHRNTNIGSSILDEIKANPKLRKKVTEKEKPCSDYDSASSDVIFVGEEEEPTLNIASPSASRKTPENAMDVPSIQLSEEQLSKICLPPEPPKESSATFVPSAKTDLIPMPPSAVNNIDVPSTTKKPTVETSKPEQPKKLVISLKKRDPASIVTTPMAVSGATDAKSMQLSERSTAGEEGVMAEASDIPPVTSVDNHMVVDQQTDATTSPAVEINSIKTNNLEHTIPNTVQAVNIAEHSDQVMPTDVGHVTDTSTIASNIPTTTRLFPIAATTDSDDKHVKRKQRYSDSSDSSSSSSSGSSDSSNSSSGNSSDSSSSSSGSSSGSDSSDSSSSSSDDSDSSSVSSSASDRSPRKRQSGKHSRDQIFTQKLGHKPTLKRARHDLKRHKEDSRNNVQNSKKDTCMDSKSDAPYNKTDSSKVNKSDAQYNKKGDRRGSKSDVQYSKKDEQKDKKGDVKLSKKGESKDSKSEKIYSKYDACRDSKKGAQYSKTDDYKDRERSHVSHKFTSKQEKSRSPEKKNRMDGKGHVRSFRENTFNRNIDMPEADPLEQLKKINVEPVLPILSSASSMSNKKRSNRESSPAVLPTTKISSKVEDKVRSHFSPEKTLDNKENDQLVAIDEKKKQTLTETKSLRSFKESLERKSKISIPFIKRDRFKSDGADSATSKHDQSKGIPDVISTTKIVKKAVDNTFSEKLKAKQHSLSLKSRDALQDESEKETIIQKEEVEKDTNAMRTRKLSHSSNIKMQDKIESSEDEEEGTYGTFTSEQQPIHSIENVIEPEQAAECTQVVSTQFNNSPKLPTPEVDDLKPNSKLPVISYNENDQPPKDGKSKDAELQPPPAVLDQGSGEELSEESDEESKEFNRYQQRRKKAKELEELQKREEALQKEREALEIQQQQLQKEKEEKQKQENTNEKDSLEESDSVKQTFCLTDSVPSADTEPNKLVDEASPTVIDQIRKVELAKIDKAISSSLNKEDVPTEIKKTFSKDTKQAHDVFSGAGFGSYQTLVAMSESSSKKSDDSIDMFDIAVTEAKPSAKPKRKNRWDVKEVDPPQLVSAYSSQNVLQQFETPKPVPPPLLVSYPEKAITPVDSSFDETSNLVRDILKTAQLDTKILVTKDKDDTGLRKHSHSDESEKQTSGIERRRSSNEDRLSHKTGHHSSSNSCAKSSSESSRRSSNADTSHKRSSDHHDRSSHRSPDYKSNKSSETDRSYRTSASERSSNTHRSDSHRTDTHRRSSRKSDDSRDYKSSSVTKSRLSSDFNKPLISITLKTTPDRESSKSDDTSQVKQEPIVSIIDRFKEDPQKKAEWDFLDNTLVGVRRKSVPEKGDSNFSVRKFSEISLTTSRDSDKRHVMLSDSALAVGKSKRTVLPPGNTSGDTASSNRTSSVVTTVTSKTVVSASSDYPDDGVDKRKVLLSSARPAVKSYDSTASRLSLPLPPKCSDEDSDEDSSSDEECARLRRELLQQTRARSTAKKRRYERSSSSSSEASSSSSGVMAIIKGTKKLPRLEPQAYDPNSD